MTEPRENEQVQAALAEVWSRMRPVVLRRVGAIERAAVECSAESPDVESIDIGRSEAHKLAGVLGTFGLDRGTELAHELEKRLDPEGAGADTAGLARLAAELRAVVESARIENPDA